MENRKYYGVRHYSNCYRKICAICGKAFQTGFQSQNICSFECRQAAQRERARRLMRERRNADGTKQYTPCEVCGFDLLTEMHHEGTERHILCPNHHLLITRNIKTLDEVLAMKSPEN